MHLEVQDYRGVEDAAVDDDALSDRQAAVAVVQGQVVVEFA